MCNKSKDNINLTIMLLSLILSNNVSDPVSIKRHLNTHIQLSVFLRKLFVANTYNTRLIEKICFNIIESRYILLFKTCLSLSYFETEKNL